MSYTTAWKTVSALALLTFPLSIFAVPPTCDGTWTNGASPNNNWGTPGNWTPPPFTGGCMFPGDTAGTTGTGIANFTGNLGNNVVLDVSPSLSQLNFSLGTEYTISNGGGTITFLPSGANTPSINVNVLDNTSQTISAPSTFSSTTLHINVASLQSLNFVSSTATVHGSDVEFNGSAGSGGALFIHNIGTAAINGFILTGNFTIDGGNLENRSDTSISAGAVGSDFRCNQLIFNNGAFSSSASVINDTGSTSVVSGFNAVGARMTTNSTTSTLTVPANAILSNFNNGTVNSQGTGALLEIGGAAGDIVINGQGQNSNTGPVSDAGGAVMHAGNFTLGSGATFSNSNLSSGTVTGSSFFGSGCLLVLPGEIDISGTYTNENSADVTSTGPGADGAEVTAISGGLGGVSVRIFDGAIVTNSNSGTITGPGSIGSLMSGGGKFIMTGGSFLNEAGGSVSGGGIGALVQFPEIDIDGGIFFNQDTVAADIVNIGPSGTLSGLNGIFFDNSLGTHAQVSNGGTFILSDVVAGGPASTTIKGNYTQSLGGSRGKLVVNIVDVTNYSQLFVTGTADITNGILEVAGSSGEFAAPFVINPGDVFTILQTGPHTVVGTFDPNIINFNIPNLTPMLQYFIDHVNLTFVPGMTPGVSGIGYAGGFGQSLIASINQINIRLNTELNRLRDQFACRATWKNTCEAKRGKENCYESSLQKDQAIMDEGCPTKDVRPWNFYAGALGSVGDVRGGKNSVGMDYWSGGALMGFDYAFSHFGIGLVAQYERVTADVDQDWGKINIDEIHASLYSTYSVPALPELSFNGIVGGSYEIYYIRRNTGSTTQKEVAKGTPKGAELDALFGVEYSFDSSRYDCMPENLYIAPLANAQYVYLEVEDYEEHEAGKFDMEFKQQHIKSLRSTLGMLAGYTWSGDTVSFTPEIFGGWQREFLNKKRNVSASSVNFEDGFTPLPVPGTGRNVWLAGIDLLMMFCHRYGVEASYNFEWNTRYHDHSFYVGFNTRF